MKWRPGANMLWCTLALAVVSPLAFASAWAVAPLAIALAAVMGGALFDRRRLKALAPAISVRRSLPIVVGRNVPFESRLTVENAAVQPVQVELRDEHPESATPRLVVFALSIPGGGSQTCTTVCRLPRRGLHAFGPVWVRLKGPLGLVEFQHALECPGQVKALPETFASREHLQKDVGAELRLLDQVQRSRQYGTGTEFESLKPFRFGDDPRRIDWRASARQRALVVRRFQVERHRDVMIVVDSGRLMGGQAGQGTKLDCAVDAALNLARVALAGGDRCGIAAYDRQVRGFLPPQAGPAALRSIVECVFALQNEWHESEFSPMLAELRAKRAKRTFLVVISDVSDAETSGRLVASLRQLQRQHLVLFAALRTPQLGQAVETPIDDVQSAARKAVAFRLLRDRARALHALTRGGVHVLDVEPRQLTLPLINQFVELRQRNLL